MHPIEQALIFAINKYPQMPLVIAYSGGVDSQVLLHTLASLKQKSLFSNPIRVCHVNHGLSENAEQWQAFAKQQCLHVSLPITVCQVNIQAQAQQSLEALAREARYQALQSISTEASVIITGHHCDDQAETFLLALKRGSGLKGLSAMAAETKQGKNLLVRPLLNISRAQIVDYANAHGLNWVEDESNQDTRFDRNFIRNEVMPTLTKRWPGIVTTINRSSDHCRDGQLLLDELAREDLKVCQHELDSLLVSELSQLSVARFNNLIRYFLALRQCLMPSTEQLTQLQQQLNANEDKNPAVKVGRHFFRRYKSALYLTADFDDISDWQIEFEGDLFKESSLNEKRLVELPDNLGALQIFATHQAQSKNIESKGVDNKGLDSKESLLVLPTKAQKVTLRFSHDNPTCLPDYRHHSRSLKKVLQELNIPPWQRKRMPFLYYDDVLVAVVGYFVCQAFMAKVSSPQASLPQAPPSLKIIWTA